MQKIKKLLTVAVLFASATAWCQQTVAPKTAPATVATDTSASTAAKGTLKPSTGLLASKLPGPIAPEKSHVPLAGEKSYFGEKNEFVNDYVRKYMEKNSHTLSTVQGRSADPFSVIDNVLEKKNLPKELKYLAVIESALNNNAVSKAGAVGPWQLMETTARMMGLNVSRRTDERKDIAKSTLAATKYLDMLYGQLNDWLLVIAAYNSGPTPVQRAIERTGSRNFWDIKEYLPRETQGHVLAFIATASIFENLSKFINLGSIPMDFKFGKEEEALIPGIAAKAPAVMPTTTDAPTAVAAAAPALTATTLVPKKIQFTEEELKNMYIVRITEPLYIDFLVQEVGFNKKEFLHWNTDYEKYAYAPASYPTPFYSLRIPKDKLDLFLQKKESLTKKSKVMFAQIR